MSRIRLAVLVLLPVVLVLGAILLVMLGRGSRPREAPGPREEVSAEKEKKPAEKPALPQGTGPSQVAGSARVSEKAAAPSPWDEAAARAFAAKGIEPPRTVLTQEKPGELDLAWIRGAIAEAVAVDPARFKDEATQDQATPALALNQDSSAPESGGPDDDVAGEEAGAPGAMSLDLGAAEPQRAAAAAPARGRPSASGKAASKAESSPAIGFSAEGADSSVEEEPREEDSATGPQKLDTRLLAPPRLGKILFQNEEGKYESLVPRALRIHAFIEGPRARTLVDYVFSNPHDRRLEGTFYYPLPSGASPAAFGMFRATAGIKAEAFASGKLLPSPRGESPGGLDEEGVLAAYAPSRPSQAELSTGACLVKDWGELELARVVEQKRAREVYEEVVRRDIDPALLEWSGSNTFQARVFPIEPGSVKRVVLVYEQTLPVSGEFLRYGYALPEASELGPIDVRISLSDAHGVLRSAAGLESLPEPSARSGGWTHYAAPFEPGKIPAVDLAISPPSPAFQVLASSESRGLPGSVFYARIRPPLEPRERQGKTGRALFLLDTSLSSAEAGHRLSAELLEKVLELDPTVEEYAVLLFDLRPRWLHAPRWRPNDGAGRRETSLELAKIYLEGATCFDAVLRELDQQASWLFEAGKPVHCFLLSDGFITWGQDRVDELLKKHPSGAAARWICYQMGSVPVNADLFDALGRSSGGRTVTILTREELPSGAKAHRTAPAVLKSVAVAGAEGKDLVVAGEPKLIFAGQELQVAGRIVSPKDSAELVVEVDVDGTPASWKVPLEAKGGSVLASRAWAELYSRKLLALDDERLDRMVVALSQRFRLANRAASFLVLDREEDYKAFDLKAETVDLSELEKLRAQEEDQRRDRLQGISLDGASEHAGAIVAALAAPAAKASRPLPSQPLLDRPVAGGDERIHAELAHREARAKDELDVKAYDAVARARALAGDTLGALRAYSCLVEKMPANAEAARLAGYACMALGQFEPAAELFERVRLNRPFEGQSYLEEALALEALGEWGKAARNYEIVLSREFPRHESECRTVAAWHYARLLQGRLREGGLEGEARMLSERRLGELGKICGSEGFDGIDLQLTIHWNTSSTDMDLWVVEPEGERCFYSHKETKAGGKLYWDITDGYGPELYQRKKAAGGTYEILVHYYGNNSARLAVPTTVLFVRDKRAFLPEDEFTRQYKLRLLSDKDAVLLLGTEEF